VGLDDTCVISHQNLLKLTEKVKSMHVILLIIKALEKKIALFAILDIQLFRDNIKATKS
jgi:hypothetical protein